MQSLRSLNEAIIAPNGDVHTGLQQGRQQALRHTAPGDDNDNDDDDFDDDDDDDDDGSDDDDFDDDDFDDDDFDDAGSDDDDDDDDDDMPTAYLPAFLSSGVHP